VLDVSPKTTPDEDGEENEVHNEETETTKTNEGIVRQYKETSFVSVSFVPSL